MDPTPQSKQPDSPTGAVASAPSGFSARRRTLLRAGAGASPVLLSLASRPVVAGTSCTVASSFVSVATWRSHNPTATSPQCTTRNCEHWLSEAMLPTHSPLLDKAVKDVLGTTGSQYNGLTIAKLLVNGGSGITQMGELGVAQHLACLALNAQNGMYMPAPGGVSAAYVGGIWQTYKSGGLNRYKTGSGIDWDSTQVIAWARMLMYPSLA